VRKYPPYTEAEVALIAKAGHATRRSGRRIMSALREIAPLFDPPRSTACLYMKWVDILRAEENRKRERQAKHGRARYSNRAKYEPRQTTVEEERHSAARYYSSFIKPPTLAQLMARR
jgi:hypothetical protein